MVWPITGAKSYVCETGKSMKAVELGAPQQDGCCNIAIALIDPESPAQQPSWLEFYRRCSRSFSVLLRETCLQELHDDPFITSCKSRVFNARVGSSRASLVLGQGVR